MRKQDRKKLLISIAVTEVTGLIGTLYTIPAIPPWYSQLIRSVITPPPWVFGPVWAILYLFMGIALFFVWKSGYTSKPVRHAMWIFAVQLVMGLLWTIIFFGWYNPAAALAEIILLWGIVLVTAISFWRISRTAALLLLPYIVWITFVAYLNFQIVFLNGA